MVVDECITKKTQSGASLPLPSPFSFLLSPFSLRFFLSPLYSISLLPFTFPLFTRSSDFSFMLCRKTGCCAFPVSNLIFNFPFSIFILFLFNLHNFRFQNYALLQIVQNTLDTPFDLWYNRTVKRE